MKCLGFSQKLVILTNFLDLLVILTYYIGAKYGDQSHI